MTVASPTVDRSVYPWLGYVAFLTLILALIVLYGFNLVRWPSSPDYGWRTMYTSGPNVVSQVFGAGESAGLRPGDRIEAINGQRYGTFDELFFGNLRRNIPGTTNTYLVIRDSEPVEISVVTGRIGAAAVMARSVPLFVVGLVYILIGALVFLMKPRATASWLFFRMTCLLGIGIGLSSPADLMHPTWLYDLRFLANVLIPAAMIHLAMTFPKPLAFAERRRWVLAIPYLPSLAIFALRQMTAADHWNVPKLVFVIWIGYMVFGVVFFLGSAAWNALRDPSIITRLQSRVIFVGTILGFFIPALDLLAGTLRQSAFFQDPVLGFGIFCSLFPLSIGYTIVKHDLFAIDVIVRRTYGYVLSTGAIVATYAAMVSVANLTLGTADAARSPGFAIGFALVVVFLFEPLHRRIQRFVDRTFYRQQYDYRSAIKNLSEAMTSILDQDLILKTLVSSVVTEMVLENGALLMPAQDSPDYKLAAIEGIPQQALPNPTLPGGDPLLLLVSGKKDHVARHDIAMNPDYESEREPLQASLDALSAELILPMLYKNEVRGILSLGRKKSGKLFTPQDLDLLKTMLSQSAIALENARLFKENLQKMRMDEELKIAHDIQMDMLPDQAPRLEGLQISARTIPAREVGGDFYDFIEFKADDSVKRLGIIIGDVSGKGVSAGLLMAGARSTYRVLLDADPPVRDVMNTANKRLHQDIRKGMFVALLYAVLDTGRGTLTLSNAGQTQPLLCEPGEQPSYITTEGDTFPLGIVPDCEYEDTTLRLQPGSTVVFYTDGAVEAMNARQELYGFDRFLASVQAARDLEAPQLLDKLFDDIARFVDGTEQHDDTSIIVAKVG